MRKINFALSENMSASSREPSDALNSISLDDESSNVEVGVSQSLFADSHAIELADELRNHTSNANEMLCDVLCEQCHATHNRNKKVLLCMRIGIEMNGKPFAFEDDPVCGKCKIDRRLMAPAKDNLVTEVKRRSHINAKKN